MSQVVFITLYNLHKSEINRTIKKAQMSKWAKLAGKWADFAGKWYFSRMYPRAFLTAEAYSKRIS
jgi:hypothetical protein